MTRQTEIIELLSPSPGVKRELVIHRYGQAGTGKKVYIQAALHADEWPGLMAAQHLIPLLDAADEAGEIQGEIILVPYANPIGMGQAINGKVAGRYSFDGSGNFNRNWADLAGQAAPMLKGKLTGDQTKDIETVRHAFRQVVAQQNRKSDIAELRATLMSLSCDADYVLDLHCDGEAELHIYANIRHKEIAENFALDLDAPVLLLETDAGGGPFDEANASPWWKLSDSLAEAKDLPPACFAATVEFRGANDISDEFGQKDAQGLMSFLRREAIISGAATPQREATLSTLLHATDVVFSPIAGLVSYKANLGDIVKKGDIVAEVIDITAPDPAHGRVQLRSETDGRYFAQAVERLVRPGDSIAKIAGNEPLAHRQEGNLLEAK